MKTSNLAVSVALICACFCSCTRAFYEDAERSKTAMVRRNLVLLSSKSPSDFCISYYETNDGISNRLVTRTLRTPSLLDMGKAVVEYDSVVFVTQGGYCGKKYVKDAYKRLCWEKLYKEGGAEYFKLENLSGETIKLAIVGVQKLTTIRNEEYEIIARHPNPIYKGVPLLYLLKPETSPSKELYFETIQAHTSDGDLHSMIPRGLKKITLYPDRLGDFGSDELPFSAEKIVSLYENESQHLFLTYLDYSLELKGYAKGNTQFRRLKEEKGIELFRVVKPHEVVYNRGESPLLPLSFSGHIKVKGSNILVKEDW